MRYLLIDHITEWKAGERIRGIKNIAMSEDFLEYHFPGNPVMPGVMLLEAIAQLTGWLETASSDFKNWFLLNKVHRCSFYGFALPGDQVEFEVQSLTNENKEIKTYKAIGMVKGKKKITAEYEGSLVLMEGLENSSEQERFFRLLTREMHF